MSVVGREGFAVGRARAGETKSNTVVPRDVNSEKPPLLTQEMPELPEMLYSWMRSVLRMSIDPAAVEQAGHSGAMCA